MSTPGVVPGHEHRDAVPQQYHPEAGAEQLEVKQTIESKRDRFHRLCDQAMAHNQPV